MEVCTAELMGSDVANRALEVGSSGLGPALNHRLSIFNRHSATNLINKAHILAKCIVLITLSCYLIIVVISWLD